MAMDFDGLASMAGTCPVADILINVRPNKMFRNKFLGGTDARMGKTM